MHDDKPVPLSAQPDKPSSVIRACSLTLPAAVALLRHWWPGLFDGDQLRALKVGVKEDLYAEIQARALPVTRRQVDISLKVLMRSDAYRRGIRAGVVRYDASGSPGGTVTEKEALAAQVKRLQRRKREVTAPTE